MKKVQNQALLCFVRKEIFNEYSIARCLSFTNNKFTVWAQTIMVHESIIVPSI